MNSSIIEDYGSLFIQGALVTLAIVFSAIVCATILGTVIAVMRTSHVRILSGTAAVYVWFFRGIPSLLALFFFYYATPSLGLTLTAFQAGLCAMTLTSAAFISEIIRSGLESVDKAELEAAEAIGMSPLRRAVRVTFPQVVRTVTPPYISNTVIIMKESAQVSVITVPDLMFQAQKAYNATYSPLETLGVAAVLYLAMTSILMLVQQAVERRMRIRTR